MPSKPQFKPHISSGIVCIIKLCVQCQCTLAIPLNHCRVSNLFASYCSIQIGNHTKIVLRATRIIYLLDIYYKCMMTLWLLNQRRLNTDMLQQLKACCLSISLVHVTSPLHTLYATTTQTSQEKKNLRVVTAFSRCIMNFPKISYLCPFIKNYDIHLVHQMLYTICWL